MGPARHTRSQCKIDDVHPILLVPLSTPAAAAAIGALPSPSSKRKRIEAPAPSSSGQPGDIIALANACETPSLPVGLALPPALSRLRTMNIDWMLRASSSARLAAETTLLAANMLDRLLAGTPRPTFSTNNALAAGKFQLMSLTCLWTAAKYEEIGMMDGKLDGLLGCLVRASAGLPDRKPNDEFLQMGRQLHDEDEVIQMERDVLIRLGFRLYTPSPLCFLQRVDDAELLGSSAPPGGTPWHVPRPCVWHVPVPRPSMGPPPPARSSCSRDATSTRPTPSTSSACSLGAPASYATCARRAPHPPARGERHPPSPS